MRANHWVIRRCVCLSLFIFLAPASGGAEQARYFAHTAAEDRNGVIAPWYVGRNGQCDFRVRVAAETMKRYPWATSPKTGRPAPDYMYNGRWGIAEDGTITPGKLEDWGNGDLVQRNAYAMLGMIDYYRYSGDPSAIAHVTMMADVVLGHCLTSEDHPWPRFPVSVPMRGEPYGQCNPKGMIQLDMAALFGMALARASQLTGRADWLEAAGHWGDVLAAKCNFEPGKPPWNRYANPEDVFWDDVQTGGVVMLLLFYDELERAGYIGNHEMIRRAREAGLHYVRDDLFSRWWIDDTWARDYWDWTHTVQSESLSEFLARYMMAHRDLFPTWRTDVRNILTLFMQRACVTTSSGGGVFSGAWAYPEGSQCCGRSLSYPPMQIGAGLAEYGERVDSAWARELARRQFLLATYDAHATGVVEDGMRGGQVVAGGWFQIAHPLPLKYVLDGIGWLPDVLGPNRENHLVRSSAVVTQVTYGDGRIAYTTFDATAPALDVLRLSFRPSQIQAAGQVLSETQARDANGYTVRPLSNGDFVVSIRHDGARDVLIEGEDPQDMLDEAAMEWKGAWEAHSQGRGRMTSTAHASLTASFEGNQVRVIGSVGPEGGIADVEIDGVRGLWGFDAWNPSRIHGQVLYSASGLAPGKHVITITSRGARNPLSGGDRITIEGLQYSRAAGDAGYGQGGGPIEPQRWILGYVGREDHVDANGNAWRPGTELVIRLGDMADTVKESWYVRPRRQSVARTQDPVVYAHGMHGKEFTAYVTVAPGVYHVRIKLMEHRTDESQKRAMDIDINGRSVARNLDAAATATGRPASVGFVSPNRTKVWDGLNTAVDLVFDDIKPQNGVIAIRFSGSHGGEAIVSAIEVGPGPGGTGDRPVQAIATTVPASAP